MDEPKFVYDRGVSFDSELRFNNLIAYKIIKSYSNLEAIKRKF